MKLTKNTASKISALINSLLVWDRIVGDYSKSTDQRTFAMQTYNQYANELIALGVPVNKYEGV